MFGPGEHPEAALGQHWFHAHESRNPLFLAALVLCLVIIGCAKPLESISIEKNPERAAITPDGSQIFVASSGDGKDEAGPTITIISVHNDAPMPAVISIAIDGSPGPLLVSPDGKQTYVGLDRGVDAGAIEAIDTRTKRPDFSILTPGPVRDIAFNPNGQSIYLAMEHHGLWKLSLADRSLAEIDDTEAPEGLAVTSQGLLFVSYQCTGVKPSSGGCANVKPGSTNGIGTWGHDPFGVFDTKTDTFEKWIVSSHSNPFPNVGSKLVLSPDETLIWENGYDACSLKRAAQVPQGYDFEGCPQNIKDSDDRAIINIIDVEKRVVVGTEGFVGKLPGSNYSLGASLITFFPASCHFKSNRVAVSTEQDVQIFNQNSRREVEASTNVPPIPAAGNILFSPDCKFAYVISSKDSKLHVRAVTENGTFGLVKPRPFQVAFKWYVDMWLGHYAFMAALHSFGVVILFYLMAFLNPRFARVVGRWPLLSRPLEFDVLVRKEHSVLVQLYVRQLEEEVTRSVNLKRLGATRIVPLPLKKISNRAKLNKATNTQEWIEELAHLAKTGDSFKVSLEGHGGDGKSILIRCLVRELVGTGRCAPVLLQGVNYGGEPSLTAWLQRALDLANVPLKAEVLRSLSSLVVVIDGVSEVPREKQENFWNLLRAQFEGLAEVQKLVIAGRFIGNPDTGTGASLAWDDDSVKFDILSDDVIKELAVAYLDPGGPSQEIDALPADLRKIAGRPNAFVVSYYVCIRKVTASPIKTKRDLYERVLERFVIEKNPVVRPDVLKAVLQVLVKKEYGTTGNRGLPGSKVPLTAKVNEVFREMKLADLYGPGNIPSAAKFVDYFVDFSGLVERLGDRYVFFHDSFEDWLLDETGQVHRNATAE